MLNIPAVFHCFKFSVNSFHPGEELRAVGVEFTSNLARGTWMSPPLKLGKWPMKLHLWRLAPPGHLQPAKILLWALLWSVPQLNVISNLQQRVKIDPSFLRLLFSWMSDQDHRYILEIAWRPCTTMYVNVGTEFGPNFLLEVGKCNTF